MSEERSGKSVNLRLGEERGVEVSIDEWGRIILDLSKLDPALQEEIREIMSVRPKPPRCVVLNGNCHFVKESVKIGEVALPGREKEPHA